MIELKDVGLEVTHPVRTRILHPTTLRIEAASAVAVMGPSGAGKSTLASIIGALQDPSEGSYTFRGNDIGSLSSPAKARFRGAHVGFVFQRSHLLDERSVVANVELGIIRVGDPAPARRQTALRALELVELDVLAERQAAYLSGGERHRVAIARALAKSPDVLIADEPTAALDQRTGSAILAMLHRVARESATTLLTVTHDPRVNEHADRVVTVLDGQVSCAPSR